MGGFYDSIHIKSEDRVKILSMLEQFAAKSDLKFLVGPTIKGWTAIFPSKGQDMAISAQIAPEMPADVFQLLVHDDSIFAYHFYRDGRLTDEYNSCPDYFGEEVTAAEKQRQHGQPEIFKDLLVAPANLIGIKKLLAANESEEFAFENERMVQFALSLGLANAVSSYEYLQDGERDGIQGWGRFIHVPDLRNAKRAAKVQLKAEKKRLHNAGLLLSELLPPGPKRQAIHSYVHCCADTLCGGFLICWGSMPGQPLLSFNPLESKIPVETGLAFNERFFSFEMSPSGKWFVASHAKTEVWDWSQRKIAFEVEHASRVSALGFDYAEGHLINADSDKIIISSLKTGRTEYKFEIGSGGGQRRAVLHPGGAYLVAVNRNNLSLINLETREIEKTLECKGSFIHELPPGAEMDEMIRNLQKVWSHKHLTTSDSAEDKFISNMSLIGRQLVVPRIEGISKFGFSAKGDMLFCCTVMGLRVFRWSELLSAQDETPKPVFSANCPTDDPNGGWAYDFFLDESRNQILFCSGSGKISYLNLETGRSGILLDPPEKLAIINMVLASDGIALCCTCSPCFEERNRDVRRLQFWNYPALCKAAGLP